MTIRDLLGRKYQALAWLSSFVRYLEHWQVGVRNNDRS
jgi:hypothetical protein